MATKQEIIKFFTFQKCDSCPFKEECMKLYDVTRMHSTNSQTICDAILNNI